MFQSSWRQEAHKMVHEANVKQAAAEKQLKEAQGKVCEHVAWGFFVLSEIISPHLVLLKFYYISQTVFKIAIKLLIMSLFSLRPTPRSMSYKPRWRRSRRWCWRRRLPHRTASCILSCSLREQGERTNTEAATFGTRARAVPFHPR